jgi:hypothetical protein
MSVIFGKKGKKVMGRIFAVLAILVVVSMVMLYAPGILALI